jgi:hypothetical protein
MPKITARGEQHQISKLIRQVFEIELSQGYQMDFQKWREIIGNLNNFSGKSLMKLGEFTVNLAKIRKKLGEIWEPRTKQKSQLEAQLKASRSNLKTPAKRLEEL